MKARFFDPDAGRFLQPDSIVPDYADPQSLNRYSYVLNNPLKYTDPTGHDGISTCGGCELLGYYYWYASLSPEEQWITTAYLNMLPGGETATSSCYLGCCDAACQATGDSSVITGASFCGGVALQPAPGPSGTSGPVSCYSNPQGTAGDSWTLAGLVSEACTHINCGGKQLQNTMALINNGIDALGLRSDCAQGIAKIGTAIVITSASGGAGVTLAQGGFLVTSSASAAAVSGGAIAYGVSGPYLAELVYDVAGFYIEGAQQAATCVP
jgi:hypothetical protein